ncbi:MAG: acyltransferase [Myxococcaceae bacterium]|nr:MAG: acyltransferase [Myxococcaceae bacterium]
MTGHLAGLDGVRGLAILMVMAVHFVGDAPANGPLQRLVVKAASYGVLGVDLFFVLSGFLITGLLLEAKGQPHYFRNFYARRTLRIFPLYYGVLAVLFLLLPALVTPSPLLEVARRQQAWLWTYTTNFYIALTSSWASLTYVSHFWSLAIEEHFYLVWPLVVFSFSRPVLERICVGVIVAGLALRLLLVAQGMSELSVSVLTPCRIDTLVVGALLAILVRREELGARLLHRAGSLLLGLLAAVLAISLFGVLTGLWLPVLHQLRGSLYALLFGALTLASLGGSSGGGRLGRLFRGRLLGFFGKYSYGLYVYHGLFTWYLLEVQANERLDRWFGGHDWLTLVARVVLGVGVSVVVAVLSYELMEKKFLGLKRYFESKPRKTSPGAEPAGEALLTTSPARPPSGAAGR